MPEAGTHHRGPGLPRTPIREERGRSRGGRRGQAEREQDSSRRDGRAHPAPARGPPRARGPSGREAAPAPHQEGASLTERGRCPGSARPLCGSSAVEMKLEGGPRRAPSADRAPASRDRWVSRGAPRPARPVPAGPQEAHGQGPAYLCLPSHVILFLDWTQKLFGSRTAARRKGRYLTRAAPVALGARASCLSP